MSTGSIILRSSVEIKTTYGKKKTKVKWTNHILYVSREGKVFEEKDSNPLILITQQTKIFDSEYREHCFSICTPSQKKITLSVTTGNEKEKWKDAIEKAARNSPPIHLKIVLVGDKKKLQQKLLHHFFLECGQEQLASNVLEYSYETDSIELNLDLEVTGEKVKLFLCCVGEDDYPKLRVLNYVDAKAFMLCYSYDEVKEFENIEKVWFPEVESAVQKGASLFLMSLKSHNRKVKKKNIIDTVIGQELANYLNGSFFNVDLKIKSKDIYERETTENITQCQDEFQDFESPAETFLDVLQTTLDDSRKAYIEDTVSNGTDVANMNDFDNILGISKKSNFLSFVKSRTSAMKRLASRKQIKPNTNFKNDNLVKSHITEGGSTKLNSTKKVSLGVLFRLKMLVKNMKPKPRKFKDRPKLAEDVVRDAHFVSRTQTGSLIFLGEDVLNLEE